ncbi:MAG: glycosyltransferase family 2 protein [Chitinophagaceae bacterium]|nr:MAG: glycosyltransferase family 2 protein [Chitinophagaceae bacterium]
MNNTVDDSCTKYVIHKFNLQEITSFPEFPNNSHGNYITLWWNDIALGSFYTEPYESITREDFTQMILEAIEDTVQHYAGRQKNLDKDGKALLSESFKSWQQWMEGIFSAWHWNADIKCVPVSVVVCTRNRAVHLKKCLRALMNQSCVPQEILVVDNAPSDESTLLAVKEFDGIRYIRELKPGLDFARNTGARNATMQVVAYADDDGANMAFRKEVFDKVGYFDELLDVGPFAAGCDGDSEMYFRVLNGNYTMCYNPRAISFHKHRKEIKELKRQIYDYYKGWSAAALVQQKNNPKANYARLVFRRYPYQCIRTVIRGFPLYSGWLHETLWVEVKGYLAGLYFFFRNRNRFGNPERTN